MKVETLKNDLLKNKSHDPVKNVQALFDPAYSTGGCIKSTIWEFRTK